MKWTLEALRVASNMTQTELADEFNVSMNTIANMERDSSNIKAELLKKYLVKFNVKFDDIFLGKKYENIV